jgi:ubiquitin-activating enzyme E1
MMDVEDSKSEIDESLYSRQLYVMGHEAQRRMAGSSVLIVGLNGLGVEAAKNVILSGVKKVAILDDYPTKYEDLSSQFYLSEVDIGHSRAQMSYAKLAELNPYVEVSLLQGELTESKMKDFNVIVLIDQSHKTQLEVSDYCHANNIAFIIGDTRGVFGMIFCDFGENFVVSDTNGEQAASSIVASITQDYPALVTCLEETRHNLESGDTITLTGLVGMEELNNRSFVVTKKDLFSFEIMEDTRGYSAYVRGGYVNQVKTPVTLSFSSLRTSLEAPGEFVADFNKFDAFNTTHLAWRALHAYRETFGEFPKAGSKADAKTLLDIAYRMNKESSGFKVDEEELQRNESVITNMAVCARGQVSPMCSALGGILGQEILKASSGKFMPIKQWMYMDAQEALPSPPLDEAEVSPTGARNDGQIMVFGKSLQEKLGSLNMFLVGAGAIGCEILKIWAMMGVSTGFGKGTTYVTDMDNIEKSNLSRQFLFRNSDIGQMKSATAAKVPTAACVIYTFMIQRAGFVLMSASKSRTK